MTPLSIRAQQMLAVFQRVPAVPTETVEKLLREQLGFQPFSPWLDFHERYAGYVQPIGYDSAIWGLIHKNSRYIRPNRAAWTKLSSDMYTIDCADVHPSYVMYISNDGQYYSDTTSTKNFTKFVEQHAVYWEFLYERDHPPARYSGNTITPDHVSRLETEAELVPEASDRYSKTYRGPEIMGFKCTYPRPFQDLGWTEVFVHEPPEVLEPMPRPYRRSWWSYLLCG